MRVCVIGGGPAGMMAAQVAAANGNNVILFEQNEKLGKKLFLTGKGRCNLTNACDTEELFSNIVRNPKFLYSSIYGFTNSDVIKFFEDAGMKTKVERGNRVFPLSDHSSDVIFALERELKNRRVAIRLNHGISELEIESIDGVDRITGVIDNNGVLTQCDAVILATGGMSYASTGSDGKMLSTLTKYNVDVKDMQPSLVPLVCTDEYVTSMQGLSLKNVEVHMLVNNKKRYEGFGEMLFTHFGVSGPLILSASTTLSADDYNKNILLNIDLKPALSYDELDKRIINDFTENQNKNFDNSLNKLLPNKLIASVIELSGIDPKKRVNLVTKEERGRLVKILKEFPIHITGNRGFNEAIISRGGVSVKEINPSTMESKKVKGLYFAGEMIDVDALTGGFNLQIAWSTGNLAGQLLGSAE